MNPALEWETRLQQPFVESLQSEEMKNTQNSNFLREQPMDALLWSVFDFMLNGKSGCLNCRSSPSKTQGLVIVRGLEWFSEPQGLMPPVGPPLSNSFEGGGQTESPMKSARMTKCTLLRLGTRSGCCVHTWASGSTQKGNMEPSCTLSICKTKGVVQVLCILGSRYVMKHLEPCDENCLSSNIKL